MNKAYKTEFQMKKLLELGTNQCQQIEDSYQKISQQIQAKMATWHSFLALIWILKDSKNAALMINWFQKNRINDKIEIKWLLNNNREEVLFPKTLSTILHKY